MTQWNRLRHEKQLQNLSDELLCREAIARNNGDAFLELFERYWGQVFRMAYSVIRDQAEAEDLAQALFLEVHTTMLGFDEHKGSFRSLLLRHAYTNAIDRRRHLERRRFYFNVPVDELDPSRFVQESPLTLGLSVEEGSRLIEQVMKHLDEKQRATVDAYFYRGLSLSEIAQELNDSFGNVRHYLYRGLEKMRKTMDATAHAEKTKEAAHHSSAELQQERVEKRLASEVSVVRPRTI